MPEEGGVCAAFTYGKHENYPQTVFDFLKTESI